MPERETTSHYATDEQACEDMAEKYGWELVETNRDHPQTGLLDVECVFEGEAEFPKGGMDYRANDESR